jgi:hypothetical protein
MDQFLPSLRQLFDKLVMSNLPLQEIPHYQIQDNTQNLVFEQV